MNDLGPKDDILKNIQEDEEEIGPIDDEDVEQIYSQKEGDEIKEDINDMKILDDGYQGAIGEYYDGDEPEEDDSQLGIDDRDDFDDEEGEEEDMNGDDESDNNEVSAMSKTNKSKQNEMIKSAIKATEEPDSHSKVSTACTNEEQMLFKIKIGSGSDS